MILLICGLLTGTTLLIGLFVNLIITETIEEQIGKRALNLAHAVALMPEIREAFEEENPSDRIQNIIEPIRQATGAKFIVIGNTDGIRYAHPLPDRLGKQMVGGDNQRALQEGEFYTSVAIGSLGPSLRGKGPIRSMDGEIVGIVSVGFMIEHIDTVMLTYKKELWFTLLLVLVLTITGAIFIASHVKRAILGLEPEEIAHLYIQKEATLQSIHEGIVAVNHKGEITLMNHAAQKLIKGQKHENGATYDDYLGRHVTDVLPQTKMLEVMETGQSQYHAEMVLGHHVVVVNRVPIFYEGKVVGVVSSFRDRSEIDRLSQELNRIKQYADALRAQTHEFTNKLYTISGLLQLKKEKEAIALINRESECQQQWMHFLVRDVPDPLISAIILGKLNRAHELGVEMIIDEESRLTYETESQEREPLLTILGNLIENALEASLSTRGKPRVKVSFTDLGHDLIFEIEDSGPGIPDDKVEQIFTGGYSTKQGHHRGVGLALVKQAVYELNGHIILEESELGGACFSVIVPKNERQEKGG
ncbi:ATP-binding protein [Caldalkalibacillus salinus]|uniref:ATP-binding protein n=1 Tax=Caldalkalibacillus salinus TaxID=2803787 RepID=UPI001921732F|nr:sensor histidine kinase [Caldalkalibacillus salinus]